MTDRREPHSLHWRINGSVLSVLTGLLMSVLIGGLTGAAYAQCNPIQAAKLLAADGTANDRFGVSVSVSGNTAVIGAWWDDSNGIDSGSAYVYTLDGGVWTQQAKLLPADGTANDFFGWSVSCNGETVVIGAFFDDDNGTDSGSAYVFTRNSGVWTQQAKLLPGDGGAGHLFGFSVSISGNTAVIGADADNENGPGSGSAYVFTHSGGVWTQQGKLLPADGVASDFFGFSVSASGDTAVIGAHQDDDNGNASGSAYVFSNTGGVGGVWMQQGKLLPADGAAGDIFGISVSVSGDTAVIGAQFDDSNGTDSGSAYVFTRSGEIWIEQAKLLAVDGAAVDHFGFSVSINGDTAAIGAFRDDDNGTDSGSAYVYTRNGGIWTQQAKLLPADGAANDFFGGSVSISGNTAIIGAYLADDIGIDSGSVYAFDLHCGPCPADLTGDGAVDVLDFFVFVGFFGNGDMRADLDGSGALDVLDFFAFITFFAAGCP